MLLSTANSTHSCYCCCCCWWWCYYPHSWSNSGYCLLWLLSSYTLFLLRFFFCLCPYWFLHHYRSFVIKQIDTLSRRCSRTHTRFCPRKCTTQWTSKLLLSVTDIKHFIQNQGLVYTKYKKQNTKYKSMPKFTFGWNSFWLLWLFYTQNDYL